MTAKKWISKDVNILFVLFVLVVSDFWLLERWGSDQIPLINHENCELLIMKFIKFCTVCL